MHLSLIFDLRCFVAILNVPPNLYSQSFRVHKNKVFSKITNLKILHLKFQDFLRNSESFSLFIFQKKSVELLNTKMQLKPWTKDKALPSKYNQNRRLG